LNRAVGQALADQGLYLATQALETRFNIKQGHSRAAKLQDPASWLGE
jgi:hypothetical protein